MKVVETNSWLNLIKITLVNLCIKDRDLGSWDCSWGLNSKPGPCCSLTQWFPDIEYFRNDWESTAPLAWNKSSEQEDNGECEVNQDL